MKSKDDLYDWINDLQTGLYINCVYCGHRYGPKDVEVPQEALKRHVATCEEHPLAKLLHKCECVLELMETCQNDSDILDARHLLIMAIEEARQ